jgi:transposase-like protein
LAQLPRRCPNCGQETIVGHGRRRKQAHDERHDWIWVRRGRCPACKKTFTVLPSWSPPYGHYSYNCRQQTWDAIMEGNPPPHCRDATRLPDDSTTPRWVWRKFVSVWTWITLPFRWTAADFFGAPTILAWDLAAAGRILRLEANSP